MPDGFFTVWVIKHLSTPFPRMSTTLIRRVERVSSPPLSVKSTPPAGVEGVPSLQCARPRLIWRNGRYSWGACQSHRATVCTPCARLWEDARALVLRTGMADRVSIAVTATCGGKTPSEIDLFHKHLNALTRNTNKRLRRRFAGVEYARVLEWQSRGALHAHITYVFPLGTDPAEAQATLTAAFAEVSTANGAVTWGDVDVQSVYSPEGWAGYMVKDTTAAPITASGRTYRRFSRSRGWAGGMTLLSARSQILRT